MKTLMNTTAAAMLIATPIFADSHVSDVDMTTTEESTYATDMAQTDVMTDDDTVVEEMVADSDIETEDSGLTDDTVIAAADDFTAEELEGVVVYSMNDENVGEIGDLIVDLDGTVEAAIINVGGFIGLGEKPVEVAMSDLNIFRTGEDDELRVEISMTEAELEALPEYEG